jgi:hypothetical protein
MSVQGGDTQIMRGEKEEKRTINETTEGMGKKLKEKERNPCSWKVHFGNS